MSGPDLMRTMRTKFPDLSIEELLDRVRSDMIDGHITKLCAIRTNDILDLLSEAHAWNLSQEDVTELVRRIAQTFPEPIASDATGMLETKSAWMIYKFISKLKKPATTGCFSNFFWSSRSSNTRGKSPPRPRSKI